MAKSNKTSETLASVNKAAQPAVNTARHAKSSLFGAITSVFDTVNSVASAANGAVGVVTNTVEDASKYHELTSQAHYQMKATRKLNAIQDELDADENAKQMFDKIAAEW